MKGCSPDTSITKRRKLEDFRSFEGTEKRCRRAASVDSSLRNITSTNSNAIANKRTILKYLKLNSDAKYYTQNECARNRKAFRNCDEHSTFFDRCNDGTYTLKRFTINEYVSDRHYIRLPDVCRISINDRISKLIKVKGCEKLHFKGRCSKKFLRGRTIVMANATTNRKANFSVELTVDDMLKLRKKRKALKFGRHYSDNSTKSIKSNMKIVDHNDNTVLKEKKQKLGIEENNKNAICSDSGLDSSISDNSTSEERNKSVICLDSSFEKSTVDKEKVEECTNSDEKPTADKEKIQECTNSITKRVIEFVNDDSVITIIPDLSYISDIQGNMQNKKTVSGSKIKPMAVNTLNPSDMKKNVKQSDPPVSTKNTLQSTSAGTLEPSVTGRSSPDVIFVKEERLPQSKILSIKQNVKFKQKYKKLNNSKRNKKNSTVILLDDSEDDARSFVVGRKKTNGSQEQVKTRNTFLTKLPATNLQASKLANLTHTANIANQSAGTNLLNEKISKLKDANSAIQTKLNKSKGKKNPSNNMSLGVINSSSSKFDLLAALKIDQIVPLISQLLAIQQNQLNGNDKVRLQKVDAPKTVSTSVATTTNPNVTHTSVTYTSNVNIQSAESTCTKINCTNVVRNNVTSNQCHHCCSCSSLRASSKDSVVTSQSHMDNGAVHITSTNILQINADPTPRLHNDVNKSQMNNELVLSTPNNINSLLGNIYNISPLIRRGLREIIIDGSNVALSYTNGALFSIEGLQIAIDYFVKRGHKVIAFVPQYRLRHGECSSPEMLRKLADKHYVVFTPSREINGRRITPYDDRYIIEYATIREGIVVSNDQYRDLLVERQEWRETIEQRLLMPTWVGNTLMFPEDPLGRYGPKLAEFLRFP